MRTQNAAKRRSLEHPLYNFVAEDYRTAGLSMMGVYPTRYRLPRAHCTEIGRIITRFAALESKINKCGWVLLRINPKQARVAMRLGRTDTSLSALEALIKIAGITVRTDIAKLKEPFKKLENMRDVLSHAVWVRHGATKHPVMQVTTGLIPGLKKADAIINPGAGQVTVGALRNVVRSIDNAVKAIDQLGLEIDKAIATASRKKSP